MRGRKTSAEPSKTPATVGKSQPLGLGDRPDEGNHQPSRAETVGSRAPSQLSDHSNFFTCVIKRFCLVGGLNEHNGGKTTVYIPA